METRSSSCLIVLGASSYPQCPELDNPSIAASAEALRQYFSETAELNVAQQHVLNLFGSPANATDQMLLVRRHLKDFEIEAGDARKNVFLIYVGHGLIEHGHFSLAIAATDASAQALTSLNIETIANQLKTLAVWSRRFVILDCCYAAEALRQFLSNDGLTREAERAFESSEAHYPTTDPQRGTTVLCAADRYSRARAPREQTFTLFTGALLDVLKGGSAKAPRMMTFGNIFDLVRARLDKPGLPNPMLVSPDQTEGDLAQSLRLFPNSARSHSRTRRRVSATSSPEAAQMPSDGKEIGNRTMRFARGNRRSGTHNWSLPDSSLASRDSPVRPWRGLWKVSYRWPPVALRKRQDERERPQARYSPPSEETLGKQRKKIWRRGLRWPWIGLGLLVVAAIALSVLRPSTPASTSIGDSSAVNPSASAATPTTGGEAPTVNSGTSSDTSGAGGDTSTTSSTSDNSASTVTSENVYNKGGFMEGFNPNGVTPSPHHK